MRLPEAHGARVGDKQKLADPAPGRGWTRPETYLGAMARKRRFRRERGGKPRTQPEKPRLLLSTVPFLALLALLAVLAVAIMVLAFPGSQPPSRPQVAAKEQGVADRGWFQEAEREMNQR
ncbi:MAG TPA: hypothetical protein VJT70_03220 [Sphingomicrobium sp.]|nr:hypothetical protein [Sphingomicrobium sp.]